MNSTIKQRYSAARMAYTNPSQHRKFSSFGHTHNLATSIMFSVLPNTEQVILATMGSDIHKLIGPKIVSFFPERASRSEDDYRSIEAMIYMGGSHMPRPWTISSVRANSPRSLPRQEPSVEANVCYKGHLLDTQHGHPKACALAVWISSWIRRHQS